VQAHPRRLTCSGPQRDNSIILHQHPSQKSKPFTFQTTQISAFQTHFISGSRFNGIHKQATISIRPPGTKPLSHSIATSTSANGITPSLGLMQVPYCHWNASRLAAGPSQRLTTLTGQNGYPSVSHDVGFEVCVSLLEFWISVCPGVGARGYIDTASQLRNTPRGAT
jgi:hypothetical protein